MPAVVRTKIRAERQFGRHTYVCHAAKDQWEVFVIMILNLQISLGNLDFYYVFISFYIECIDQS